LLLVTGHSHRTFAPDIIVIICSYRLDSNNFFKNMLIF
jgi:hypothetical protein